jgi:Cohesin domain
VDPQRRHWPGRTTPTAIILGVALLVGTFAAPAGAAAAGNTLRIQPASTTAITVGATFTVKVVQNADVPTGGAQATVTFDPVKLKIMGVTAGAPYAAAVFLGVGATQIAAANVSGSLKTVAAGFLPPASAPTGDQDFLVISFKALAAGVANLGLPVGPADAVLLDGRADTYGNPLTTTTTGGTVSIVGPPTASMHALPAWVSTNALALSWSGTPGGAAIASYDVRYRRAKWNGTFGVQTAWQSATTATSATLSASTGYTYCVSARARDTDGKLSAWTKETCSAIPLDDRALTRTGSWTAGTGTAYFRSTYLRSTSSTAKLTRTGVRVRRLAIVATTCPTCGTVKVYLGSTLLKSVSLYSATTVNRKLITVKTFPSVRTGTLSIRVTSKSPKRVIIDGLAISAT